MVPVWSNRYHTEKSWLFLYQFVLQKEVFGWSDNLPYIVRDNEKFTSVREVAAFRHTIRTKEFAGVGNTRGGGLVHNLFKLMLCIKKLRAPQF
jgi:hypothetical protein